MAVNEKSITLREIFSTVKEKKIRFIDLKFPDLFGSPQRKRHADQAGPGLDVYRPIF
jgi:hypothetical protein